MNRRLRSLSLLLPLLWTAASCGDDEEGSEPVAPPGPATLAIASLTGSDGVPVPKEEIGTLAVCRHLAVTVTPANFTLRPPGTCGSTPQCGHLAVRVDPGPGTEASLVEAATNTLVLDLSSLDPLAGPHTVRAELRRSDRSVYAGADGVEVADEIGVELELGDCDEGAGGTGGAGGAGGAPSVAGQGGGGAGGQAGAGGEAGSAAGATGLAGAGAGGEVGGGGAPGTG